MSVRVMSLVWDSNVPAPERFTLLALADRADEEGKCWPSIPTLKRKCMTSERSVRRHLKVLEEMGLLSVQHRFNDSSVYTINLARLRELTVNTPSQSATPSQTDTPRQDATPSQSARGAQDGRTPRQIDRTPPGNLAAYPPVDTSRDTSGGARKRGTRIPQGFADTLTDDLQAWARQRCPDVDPRAETEQFVLWAESTSGQQAVKIDWVKAWKKWLLKEQTVAEQRRPAHLKVVPKPATLPTDADEAIRDLWRRADAVAASHLIRKVWTDPGRKPSDPDPTPYLDWVKARRREFIEQHRDELRAALKARSAG